MLVLSRQFDETIMIGDDIEVRVVAIRGDKVRLGITAPARLPVHRKEIYELIRRRRGGANLLSLNEIIAREREQPGSVIPHAGAERTKEAVPRKGTRRRGGLDATGEKP